MDDAPLSLWTGPAAAAASPGWGPGG